MSTLHNITPFRQMKNAYASLLSLANSAKEISTAVARLSATAPAGTVSSEPTGVSIYDRLGCRLLLDPSSLVDRCVINQGSWEPEQVAYFLQLAERFRGKEKTAFLDIGAYWGMYSLLFAKAGLASEIFAFEADRHNFAQLQSNVFLNGAARQIKAFNKAVSESDHLMYAWDSTSHPDGNRGGVGMVHQGFEYATMEVDGVTLDSFLGLKDRNLIVKIDVEGHEQHVLLGMERTVKENRILMQVEVYEPQQPVTFAILERMGLRRIHQIDHDFYYTNIDM
ncbi:FkbM family methyltransferase [Rugamonas sp. CCM 8940]|uniref:FkbM family methyltransferase n=1 Tax=Rugamonas sp. CCM 8940 TaxID=2765359 RepID=UPI0018F27A76|nr:FkbM family methyltransferase [Rugamonas sp. CCM 8940]MBJ7311890.1 FkbM family methyltransferase [Rugamonas sp. CCM 8940]